MKTEALPLDAWLPFAIRLADAVAKLHDQGRVHADIRPANLAVAGTELVLAPCETSHPAYMAPERTGRMNRAIDTRADLYSVGITLYELATGALPFQAKDAIEWSHCHLARPPAPPPGLPPVLAQIVLKLLAKTADDRYQTASGLAADLRAYAAGQPFELGHDDVSARFTIPDRLYGRERELAQLQAAFARVVEHGQREVVLVSGYSGVGKSSVIRELHKSFTGLFAVGKHDQQKHGIPYAPFAQAFRGLIDAVPPDALRDALAVNGALIVDLIPELAAIVGELPAVPEAPPADAQRRFHDVFRRFLAVFARERPLVLFLDDLQWFDDASASLLLHLATEPSVRQLLLIGAYRDNEPGAARFETIQAERIALAPLWRGDLARLVGDALRTTPDRAVALADLIHDKTAGNPFFAIQLLNTLLERQLVVFDGTRWRWDLEKIRGYGFTDNVAELVTSRLELLPRDGLRRLACLGHRLTVELPAPLQPFIDSGVIVPVEQGYAFAHDRILEAAYAMIPADERAREHALLGWKLAAREASLFEIVHHLNRGATAMSGRAERDRAAKLDLEASLRARSSAAASAHAYALAGRGFLDEDSWTRAHALTFELELQLAECELAVADLAASEARLDALTLRATTFAESAAVMFVQGKLYTQMAGRSERAIQIALALLERAGIVWPEHPGKELVDREYAELVARIGNRTVEELCDRPPLADETVRCLLEVLHGMFGASHAADQNLLCLLLCRMGNLGLEHGFSDASPFAFAYLGMIVAGHFGDVPTGYKLAKLALDLVDRGFQRYRGRVYHTFGTHVVPFAEPIANAEAWLRRAQDAERDAGDVTYLAFSSLTIGTGLLARGMPLARTMVEIEAARDIAQGLKFDLVSDCVAGMLRLGRALRDRETLADRSLDARFEADAAPEARGQPITFGFYWTRAMQAHFIYHQLPEAIAALAKAEPGVALNHGFFELAEFHSSAALVRIAAGHDREAILRDRDRLAAWAEHCPENFADRVALVTAELARRDGDDLLAMRQYEQAIRTARAHGLVAREALALELAARFYADRDYATTAEAYLARALDAYRRWGADGKVRQLEELHPMLRREDKPASLDRLDLATVVKTSEAVSVEIGVDRLIDSLMTIALQHAGAQRGLLVLFHDGAPSVEAEASTHPDGVRVCVQRTPVRGDELPISVLNRALHDRETVLLDDARSSDGLSSDRYLATARSVLCLPLLKERDVIGGLYLENNLTSHAFRRDHLDVLKLLAAHAAISLENAWLEQKQALLKEIHHRVKNNLQLVSSLLNLQAARIKDPAVAELLADSRNRVRSMALVHENLYRAGDFSRIPMASHIKSLCAQLIRAYHVPEQRVELLVDAGELQLDMSRAVTCGLIINELVSNALKHAFPHGRHGTIRIDASPHVLRVSDDGVGLPEGLDWGRADSLGIQLVRDLTAQLQGTITIDRARGTSFTIELS